MIARAMGWYGQHQREVNMLLFAAILIMGGKDTSCDYPAEGS